MNQKQALTQARKRWGKTAAVKYEPGRGQRPHHDGDYVVGKIMGGLLFEVKGEGATWTAALARADMKWAIDQLRYRLLAEDYKWQEPGPDAKVRDQDVVETMSCDTCRKRGLSYFPAHREDGTDYRAFAVCGSCGKHQEFTS